MAMRDLASRIKAVPALARAVRTADIDSSEVDRAGYRSVTLLLKVEAGGIVFDATNRIDFKLLHSDDNVTFAAVGVRDVAGITVGAGGIVNSLIAAHAAEATFKAGYIGGKRYIKAQADFSGVHGTGTAFSMDWLLGDPALAPVS